MNPDDTNPDMVCDASHPAPPPPPPVRARKPAALMTLLRRGDISPSECRILTRVRAKLHGMDEQTAERLICGLVEGDMIANVTDARDALAHLCAGPVERFVVAVLSRTGRLIATEVASVGSNKMTVCDVSHVLRIALAHPQAASIIVAHNHPSGSTEPSMQDIDATRKIRVGCEAVGLQFHDALVIGWAGRFVSMRERGIL